MGIPGTIDTSFDYGTGFTNNTFDIIYSPDNKIYVGGFYTTYKGSNISCLVRLLPNGDIDPTFNTGSGFGWSFSSPGVGCLKLDNSGKLLVGGFFDSYNGTSVAYGMVRLNSDGSLDTSFNIGLGFDTNGYPYTIDIQSDGKIIVGGSFNSYNGTPVGYIVRLLEDGTHDTTFGQGIADFTSYVYMVNVRNDDSILCSGSFAGFTDNNSSYGPQSFAVLNSDGTFDISFASGTTFTVPYFDYECTCNLIQSDNKIIVGGQFTSYDTISVGGGIIRLNVDGTIDNTFNSLGFTWSLGTPRVSDIKIFPNGKFICVGDFNSYDGITANNIVVLKSNGVPETNFQFGNGFNGPPYRIALDSDNNIYCAGQFTSFG